MLFLDISILIIFTIDITGARAAAAKDEVDYFAILNFCAFLAAKRRAEAMS